MTPPGVALGSSTTKVRALLVVLPTCTVTGPVVAASGTFATMEVALALVTVASVPLKSTVFCDVMGLKPCPPITTGEDVIAAGGLRLVMASAGGPWMVKTEVAPCAVVSPYLSRMPVSTTSEQRAEKVSDCTGWKKNVFRSAGALKPPEIGWDPTKSFIFATTLVESMALLKIADTAVPALRPGGPVRRSQRHHRRRQHAVGHHDLRRGEDGDAGHPQHADDERIGPRDAREPPPHRDLAVRVGDVPERRVPVVEDGQQARDAVEAQHGADLRVPVAVRRAEAQRLRQERALKPALTPARDERERRRATQAEEAHARRAGSRVPGCGCDPELTAVGRQREALRMCRVGM